MNRILAYIVLPLIAAAASIYNLISFWLENLLRPSWPEPTNIAWFAAFAAIVLAAIAAFFSMRQGTRAPRSRLVLALIVIVAAGFAPRLVDMKVEEQEHARDQAEGAGVEMEFQSAYLDRSDDLEARIAASKPFTAEEALDFLDFAADADLSYRSLPDHTPETLALLGEALQAHVVDPNARMASGPSADSPATTVTAAFYDTRIRQSSPHTIAKHDWDVLQLLVTNGADVSSPDAAAIRADLARTVVPGPGRFLELR